MTAVNLWAVLELGVIAFCTIALLMVWIIAKVVIGLPRATRRRLWSLVSRRPDKDDKAFRYWEKSQIAKGRAAMRRDRRWSN